MARAVQCTRRAFYQPRRPRKERHEVPSSSRSATRERRRGRRRASAGGPQGQGKTHEDTTHFSTKKHAYPPFFARFANGSMSSAASPASSDGRRGRDVTKVGFVVVFGFATERAADEDEYFRKMAAADRGAAAGEAAAPEEEVMASIAGAAWVAQALKAASRDLKHSRVRNHLSNARSNSRLGACAPRGPTHRAQTTLSNHHTEHRR